MIYTCYGYSADQNVTGIEGEGYPLRGATQKGAATQRNDSDVAKSQIKATLSADRHNIIRPERKLLNRELQFKSSFKSIEPTKPEGSSE